MKKFIRQLTNFSLIFIMTFGVGFSSQNGNKCAGSNNTDYKSQMWKAP